MINISFIGHVNQTNDLISSLIKAHFKAEVRFLAPKIVLEDPSTLNKSSPDLVIFDLHTSSGLGKATQNIVLLSNAVKDTPMLVLHNYQQEKFIQPFLEAGADKTLPIAPTEDSLLKTLEELLDAT